VLTASVPPTVTVVPLWLTTESPIAWLPLNNARFPVVPPDVVTLPPTPLQLPAVVQMLYVPPAADWNRYVTFAVGAAKPTLVVNPPLVFVIVVADPCSVRAFPVFPTVKFELLLIFVSPVNEVISLLAPEAAAPRLVRAAPAEVVPVPPCEIDNAVVRPEMLVMSLLAPLAAAPRLVRAPEAVVAPVPPLVTASALVKVKAANVGELVTAISCGAAKVMVVPAVLTIIWLLVPTIVRAPL
jgi:hypothetical protein